VLRARRDERCHLLLLLLLLLLCVCSLRPAQTERPFYAAAVTCPVADMYYGERVCVCVWLCSRDCVDGCLAPASPSCLADPPHATPGTLRCKDENEAFRQYYAQLHEQFNQRVQQPAWKHDAQEQQEQQQQRPPEVRWRPPTEEERQQQESSWSWWRR
jgi:hypothetical protein